MKYIVIIICLYAHFLSAQNRFQYHLSFKIDSLNRDFVQEETFNLDFYDDESLFYPEGFAKKDSILARGGSINRSNIPEPQLDYIISKNHKSNEITFKEMIGLTMLSIIEPRAMDWKIINESKTYQNYKLRKAITSFAGRNWTAWFSEEIPIFDGPYKFKGLPGLIFILEDEKRDYIFELGKIEKLTKPTELQFLSKLGINPIKTDYEKYKKIKKDFSENPAAFLLQGRGLENLPAEELKKINDGFKSREHQQNNRIELTL